MLCTNRKPIGKSQPKAPILRSGLELALPLLLAFFLLLGLGGSSAFAMPPNPIEPPPIGGGGGGGTFTPPDNGFAWAMSPRFGLMKDGLVDYHWDPATARYDPAYVHPTSETVSLDGCYTAADSEAGTGTPSGYTYNWTLDGTAMENPDNNCSLQHTFDVTDSHSITRTVQLIVLDKSLEPITDSQGRGNPFSQTLVLKDLLIVSIGDSYGSGEGAPDVPQIFGNFDVFGQPQSASPARWEDERCHRSAKAPAAQAARALESADPHSSVTFLSFACSGATINKGWYLDQSSFQPYRDPIWEGSRKFMGSGILGQYAGTVPPDPNHPENSMLPSQMDQLATALKGADGTKRPVDALIISGGGNDMGFGNIAGLCMLYYDCQDHLVQTEDMSEIKLRDRVSQDTATLPDRYTALANAITEKVPFTPIGKVYLDEYPDPTKNDSGAYCDEILDDVMPVAMQPVLAAAAAADYWAPVPLPFYSMTGGELTWAGDTVLPGLNSAIRAAATVHGWEAITGIADETGNLFSGHGFCASDNWINTATEGMDTEGPWAPWEVPVVPPNTTKTLGTLHPNAQGHYQVGMKIKDHLVANLLPTPPANPPVFVGSTNQSVVGANGWLIGHGAGSCPAGASDCVFVQESAAVSGTNLRGASLLVNGTEVSCSAAGTTTNGVTCQGQLANSQTYTWSLALTDDGLTQLEFNASGWNGALGKATRQIKVDLHNPTVSRALSDALPTSGWYTGPMTVTLNGADGSGSGVKNVLYQLDGVSSTQSGSSYPVRIDTDGVHTLTYHAADAAGRSNSDQSLTVKLDQTSPEVTITPASDPNPDGWYGADVTLTLDATDTGGSGIDHYSYSADGAQSVAETIVNDESPTDVTISKEGTTTITVTATDLAGNTGSKDLVIKIDRTAPATAITTSQEANAAGWNNKDVQVTLTPVDKEGSGVAKYTYSASGAQSIAEKTVNGATPTVVTISAEGTTTVTVSATDAVGNVESQKQLALNLDKTAPTVTINSPFATGYLLNQDVKADYAYSDGLSGIDSYTGTVANGASIDTSTSGTKSFIVTASDKAGNTATKTVSYAVKYAVSVLFDQTRSFKLGSTAPLKMQLKDALGVNVSSATLLPVAGKRLKVDSSASTALADISSNSNPDSAFRYDSTLQGYIFNLSTKGLTTGTWDLQFSVPGGPTVYDLYFDLR